MEKLQQLLTQFNQALSKEDLESEEVKILTFHKETIEQAIQSKIILGDFAISNYNKIIDLYK